MYFAHIDIAALVKALGYLGLFCVVFAESGLFFGFFLPGDSLLFAAGLLATQGFFNPFFLIIILALAAILGDSIGFFFGKKVGPKIFTKEDSLFFRRAYVERTQKFYEKYGSRTIILARFVPVVRTFAPILAGVGSMDYKKFLSYNIFGGTAWTMLLVALGYFLGTTVPNAEHYLGYIIGGIIVVSFLPMLYELRRSR